MVHTALSLSLSLSRTISKRASMLSEDKKGTINKLHFFFKKNNKVYEPRFVHLIKEEEEEDLKDYIHILPVHRIESI